MKAAKIFVLAVFCYRRIGLAKPLRTFITVMHEYDAITRIDVINRLQYDTEYRVITKGEGANRWNGNRLLIFVW
ncbi:hypothetical protein [Brevibacillus daliensis]|uniref:hypothetical protein n=1 Tax=Brevibacillus daliensis TaxID=2892995 RepID=UPI001E5196C9|nr:hypothetical protein [Brevibacillus daliensis]